MKNLINIFGSLFLVFILFSCGKDADPALEIYVSAKKSDLYQSITMGHGYIRLFDGENGISSIQQYDGLDVQIDLTKEDNPILAGDVSHWAGIYNGLNAYLYNIEAVTLEGNTIKAFTLKNASQQKYGGEFELIDNVRYRIDFIYDIDKSIIIQESENAFDTVVEVKITQL